MSGHEESQFTWVNWNARIQNLNGKQRVPELLYTLFVLLYTFFYRLARIAVAVSMSYALQICVQ